MAQKNFKKKETVKEVRHDDMLYGNYQVRVVIPKEDGSESKICSLREAKGIASEMGLNIYEVSPDSNPPVMKIGDYSKYMYEQKKAFKLKEKQKREGGEVKEVQLATNIFIHDLETKAKAARKFIENGDKVKVVLRMKRREVERREQSEKCLYEFISMLMDIAKLESMPKQEGNRSTAILRKK